MPVDSHPRPGLTALIAEDEPLLAQALQQALQRCWPELNVVATVGDGCSAVEQSLKWAPDVLWFDIRMPGQTGLEAAADIADAWPVQHPHRPMPALVFVTAYEQFAVQAFETHAVDYLLKPVQDDRLMKCKQKIASSMDGKENNAIDFANLPTQLWPALQHTLAQGLAQLNVPRSPSLKHIQASEPGSQGQRVVWIAVDDVLCFEAADKYLRVLTAQDEWWIRTPLKTLLEQLDPEQFWQVHRGSVVQTSAIQAFFKDEWGRGWLQLQHLKAPIAVSKLHAHRFKAM